MKKKISRLAGFLSVLLLSMLYAVPVYAYDGSEGGLPIAKYVIIALIVGFIIGGIINLIKRGQLKSVIANDKAASYIVPDSMKITNKREIFLYKNLQVTENPKENKQ